MTALVTRRVRQLADTIAELKVKVRAALATELAGAISNAIRDVLVVTMLDRFVGTSRSSRSRDWRDSEYDRDRERDQWGESRDPWTEDDYDRDRMQTRYELDEPEEEKPISVPAAAAVAVGVNVGRWWFAKKGSILAAVGIGIIATTLGLAGGLIARAILTVITAATDVLTAETLLARTDST